MALLMKEASSLEVFQTEGGTKFRIKATDFAMFLKAEMFALSGRGIGRFLRGEDHIPDEALAALSRYPVEVKVSPRKPLPDINRVWARLVLEVQKSIRGQGGEVGDWFARDPSTREEDMAGVLAAASADLSLDFEHSLDGRALRQYRVFMDLLESGEFGRGAFENWSPRHRKELLGEIYADAWYSEMLGAWRKLLRSPMEVARLRGLRMR
jgi:hypothetical protein